MEARKGGGKTSAVREGKQPSQTDEDKGMEGRERGDNDAAVDGE